jgi:hypothetical protein
MNELAVTWSQGSRRAYENCSSFCNCSRHFSDGFNIVFGRTHTKLFAEFSTGEAGAFNLATKAARHGYIIKCVYMQGVRFCWQCISMDRSSFWCRVHFWWTAGDISDDALLSTSICCCWGSMTIPYACICLFFYTVNVHRSVIIYACNWTSIFVNADYTALFTCDFVYIHIG